MNKEEDSNDASTAINAGGEEEEELIKRGRRGKKEGFEGCKNKTTTLIMVSYLVLLALSPTKDYIRAQKKCQSVSILFRAKVMKPQNSSKSNLSTPD